MLIIIIISSLNSFGNSYTEGNKENKYNNNNKIVE